MASADAEKTEMKIEGTVEAAEELYNDPQSHVNPDKIEEKVVEDAQQAGVPAYQFDPDASPEDKANAAKGVRERNCSSYVWYIHLADLFLALAAGFPSPQEACGRFSNHG
jgi:hypothetical protein